MRAGTSCIKFISFVLCLGGLFLHVVLSGPLLDGLGLNYSTDSGAIYEKLHPGSYFIYLAFFVMLSSGNPIREALQLYIQHRIICWLLLIYVVCFLFVLSVNGGAGHAFFLDSQITLPICTLIIFTMPAAYCRRAMDWFLLLSLLNSLIGIAETIGRFRMFPFDPSWSVLTEDYFRASALGGHPLTNAALTSVAMFLAMSLPYTAFKKILLPCVYVTSLVAFGGRAGLAVSVLGLTVLGAVEILKIFYKRDVTILRAICVAGAALAAPACIAAGLYAAINSNMGERIAQYSSLDDNSAATRQLSLLAFDYLTDEELIFGVSTARIEAIQDQIGLKYDLIYIENPWVLMIMHLGVVAFAIWMVATVVFFLRLVWRQPFALKLAVICYFLIASTFNSFAVKNSMYLIMASSVACAARLRHASPLGTWQYQARLVL